MLSRDKELPHHLKTSRSNTMAAANDTKSGSAKRGQGEPPNRNHQNGTERNPSGKRKATNPEEVKCRNCQRTCDCLQRDRTLGQISVKSAKTGPQKDAQNDAKLLNRPTVKKAELEPRENMGRRHTSKAEKCSDRDLWLFASIPALNHPDFNPDQKKYLLSLAKIYTDVSPGRQYTNMWTRTTKLINVHQHDHCRKDTCKSAKSTKSTKSRRENSTLKRKSSVPTAVDIFANGKAKEDKTKTEVKRSKSGVKSAVKTQNATVAKESKADSKTHTESPSDDYVDSYVIGIIERQMEKLKSHHKAQEIDVHGDGHARDDSTIKHEADKKESVEMRKTEKTVVVITESSANQSHVAHEETVVKEEVTLDSSEVTMNEKEQIDQSDPIRSTSVANHPESLSVEKVAVQEEPARPQLVRPAAPITSVGAVECESVEKDNEKSMADEQEVQETDTIVQEEHGKVERSDVTLMETSDVETLETEEKGLERREEVHHEHTTVVVSVTETRSTEVVHAVENDKDESNQVQTETGVVQVMKVEDDYEEDFQDEQEEHVSSDRNETNETEFMEIEETIQKETIASEMTMEVMDMDETKTRTNDLSQKEQGEVRTGQLVTEEKSSISEEHVQGGQVESNEVEVSRGTEHDEEDMAASSTEPAGIDVTEADDANDSVKGGHVAMVAVVTGSSEEIQTEQSQVTAQDNQAEAFVATTELREMEIVQKDELSTTAKQEEIHGNQEDVTTVVMESTEIEVVKVKEMVQDERADETTGVQEDGVIKAASSDENETTAAEEDQKEHTQVITSVTESSEVKVVIVEEGMMKEENGQVEHSVSLSNVATTSAANKEEIAQENDAVNIEAAQENQDYEATVVAGVSAVNVVDAGDRPAEEAGNKQTEVMSSTEGDGEMKVIQTEETDTIKGGDMHTGEETVISVVTESSEVETVKTAENDIIREEGVPITDNEEIRDVARTSESGATRAEENDSVKEVEVIAVVTKSGETEVVRMEECSVPENEGVHDVTIVATESSEIEAVTVEEESLGEQVEVMVGEIEISETKVKTEETDNINESTIQNITPEGDAVITEVDGVDLAKTEEGHTMKDGVDTESGMVAVVTESTEVEVVKVEDVTSAKEEEVTIGESSVIQDVSAINEVEVLKVGEDSTMKDEAGQNNQAEAIVIVTESVEVETVKEESVVVETVKVESGEVETVKEESVNVETIKEESVEVETIKEELVEVETVKVESGEVETVKEESVEVETIKEELVEVETVKVESGEDETVKVESGEDETIKEESVEVDTVKVESGEVETVKEESVEVETVKQEEDSIMREKVHSDQVDANTVVAESAESEVVASQENIIIREETGKEQTEVIAIVTESVETSNEEGVKNGHSEIVAMVSESSEIEAVNEVETSSGKEGEEASGIVIVAQASEVEVEHAGESNEAQNQPTEDLAEEVDSEIFKEAESATVEEKVPNEETAATDGAFEGQDGAVTANNDGNEQIEMSATVTEETATQGVTGEMDDTVPVEGSQSSQAKLVVVVAESRETELVKEEEKHEDTQVGQVEVVATVIETSGSEVVKMDGGDDSQEAVINNQVEATAVVTGSTEVELVTVEEVGSEIVVTSEVAQMSEVTVTNEVIETNEVTGTNEVTVTSEVTGTNEVTATNEVTVTSEVTGTNEVAQMSEVTVTNEVIETNEVTGTNEVTVTSEVTGTNEVTVTSEVTGTNEVTVTSEVTGTNEVTVTNDIEVEKEEKVHEVNEDGAHSDQVGVIAVVTEEASGTLEQNDVSRVMTETGEVTVVRIEESSTIRGDGENTTVITEVSESTNETAAEVVTMTVTSDETRDVGESHEAAEGGGPGTRSEAPAEGHKESEGVVLNGPTEADDSHQTRDQSGPPVAAQNGPEPAKEAGDSASPLPGLPQQA